MSDDPKKSDSPIKPFIKAGVGAANSALANLQAFSEGASQPFVTTYKFVAQQAKVAGEGARYAYQRRHEFAPEIVAGSTLLGAGVMGLRRGRLSALIGGAAAGGIAYAAVYDQISLDHMPDIGFGKKNES